jgi:chromosome segregation ATPase
MPIAFAALALAVIAFVLWLSGLSKAKAASARVASLLVENASLQEQVKQIGAEQKKSAKLLEARSDELTEIKKEIGALKKKNFALQEDAKKTRTSFEAKLEEREKQLVARPAFEHVEEEKPKGMKGEGSKAEGRKADHRSPTADSRMPMADGRSLMADGREPTSDKPATASADNELARKLENVTRENTELATRLGKVESDLRDALGERRRMKKKVEDYRRADLVAKSRVDVLNDKLGSMGRQYYDAVSELAALKGESAPPAPRPPAEKTAEAKASEASSEPADEDDEVHTLSQELVDVLQQRDASDN